MIGPEAQESARRSAGLESAVPDRSPDGILSQPDIISTRARLSRAFEEYRAGRVELLSHSLAGATHIAATRRGLYALNDKEWSHIAAGFFFGVTLRGEDLFVFEACDLPHSPLRQGRIVRFIRRGDRIIIGQVVAKGLDNGCHGIDFCAGLLHVVDTYNQQILRFTAGETAWEVISPLPTPPYGRWAKTDGRYVHANSLLRVGNTYLLLLHNSSEHTGRLSDVALFDEKWQPAGRWTLNGHSCHGLALLEDGTLLTCDSVAGDVISPHGLRISISRQLTRGLAVGKNEIVVGSSMLARREKRLHTAGQITFLDRDLRHRSTLELPGAPMELRRLDGEDSGLSSYLERSPWGSILKTPNSAA